MDYNRLVLTVAAEGRVTLRSELLDHLGVRPGDELDVRLFAGGRAEFAAVRHGSIEDFFGCLGSYIGPPVSIEEMNRAIEDGWAGLP